MKLPCSEATWALKDFVFRSKKELNASDDVMVPVIGQQLMVISYLMLLARSLQDDIILLPG